MIAAVLAFAAAVAVAAAVVIAARLDGHGKHRLPAGHRHAADEQHAARAVAWFRHAGGHPGKTGCLPAGTELLGPAAVPPDAQPWDLTTQLPRAADTGGLLAFGRITPAEAAARLDARHFGDTP